MLKWNYQQDTVKIYFGVYCMSNMTKYILLVKGTVSRGFCCFKSILGLNHYFEALLINKMLL